MSTITGSDGREAHNFSLSLSLSLLHFFFLFFGSLIDYNRMFEYYSPISNAAELGLTLNWFSISFGRNAAKPAISNPSLAPARFNMKNPGLPSRSVRARGSSRIFENASPWSLEDGCSGFWCASDTLSLASFSEPEEKRHSFLLNGRSIFHYTREYLDCCLSSRARLNFIESWNVTFKLKNHAQRNVE